MNSFSQYLYEKYGPWGWLGQRTHDAEGINKILPLDFIISCDYGEEVKYFFSEENVFSVEKHVHIRKDWSNEDLKASLNNHLGKQVFNKLRIYDKEVNLLCYRSIKYLEQLNKLKLFSSVEALKERFDNKILLYNNLPDLGLSRIEGKVDKIGNNEFDALHKSLSLPFVVQFPIGSSGHFTFVIREKDQYDAIKSKYPEQQVVMRRFIKGYSLNGNAVIVTTEKGPRVIVSYPSVQIAGLQECSNFDSAFCGNDFTATGNVDPDILGKVKKIMETVGLWMAKDGYRGIFGMDFVVKDNEVYSVEINPRFQNSTSLYTILTSSNDVTLVLFHIAQFLQQQDKKCAEYIYRNKEANLMEPVQGSQVIVHNTMKDNIISGSLQPGFYAFKDGQLAFLRGGASFSDFKNEDKALVTCGVPRKGTLIKENSPICKLQMKESVLNPLDNKTLSSDAKIIIKEMYANMGLVEAKEKKMVIFQEGAE